MLLIHFGASFVYTNRRVICLENIIRKPTDFGQSGITHSESFLINKGQERLARPHASLNNEIFNK